MLIELVICMFQIEEKSVLMQQARSNNKVLEHLMRKKIGGELPGVLGRLVCIEMFIDEINLECK